MDDFDQELRRRLTGQAAAVAPRTDLEDLVERIARDRSRGRRISALVLAMVVVVGPIAGFAIARASDGSAVKAASTRSRVKTVAPGFSPTPLPELQAGVVPTTAPNALTFSATGDKSVTQDRALLASRGQELRLGRVFARTTADGIDLRVYAARIAAPPPGVTAPACRPDRLVQVDASDDLVSGASQAFVSASPPSHVFASVRLLGVSEGSPVWVAIVRSETGTRARATFVDGGSDSMRLDGGLAVIAHTVSVRLDRTTLAQQELHVEILDARGITVAETSVTASLLAAGCAAAPPPP